MINVISKLAKYLIPAGIVSLIPFAAFASGNLEANDFVGMSFWIISIGMVAATVFFFMESMKVDAKWRTSLVVAGLVTMIAAVHYFYMRGVWIETADTPTVYRYIDWILTVPLQIVEFYLFLAAVGDGLRRGWNTNSQAQPDFPLRQQVLLLWLLLHETT